VEAVATRTKRKPLERWQLDDARRLKRLFNEHAKMSQEKFGQAHGIGTQGAVWQYLEGRIPLNLSVALKFAEGLGCSLREISPHLADQLDKANKARQPPSHYNVSAGPELRGRVPLISWTTAGKWAEAQDPYGPGEAEEWVVTTATVGPNAFALRVVGDSMEPKIPDGAIVIIDPARNFQHGSIVLAKRTGDQEATLKQLWYDGAVPKLRPLNARYAILEMPPDTRIIGVAVRIELDL
jgi:SOS-response transcriptional repressor LexA